MAAIILVVRPQFSIEIELALLLSSSPQTSAATAAILGEHRIYITGNPRVVVMAIDPLSINNLLRQFESRQQARLDSVVNSSDLKIEKTVSALIKAVAPANQEQIDALLLQEKSTPQAKTLLQSQSLKLVQLEIEGKNLLTFTDRPLNAGEKIQLTRNNNQWYFKIEPKTDNTAARDLHKNNLATQALNALSSSTRQALSTQQPPHRLINHLVKLLQNPPPSPVSKSSTANTDSNFAKDLNIIQSLKPLLDSVKTPQQLASGSEIKNQVTNSGVFLERKLVQSLVDLTRSFESKPKPQNAQDTNSSIATQQYTNNTGKRPVIESLFDRLKQWRQQQTHLKPATEANSNPIPKTNSANKEPQTPSKPATTSDLKALLLRAKQAIEDYLRAEFSHAPSPLHQTTATSPKFNGQPSSAVDNLIQQWLRASASTAKDNTPARPIREQLVQALQQQVIASLGRIQLHQSSALSQQLTQPDSPQQFNVDIPVRINEEFHNIELAFEEEWVEEDAEGQDSPFKVKQWNVLLTLELPAAGTLYARVRMHGEQDGSNKVSVNFWAQLPETLREVNAKLQQLQQDLSNQGVEVKELQCLTGTPQRKTIAFDYALVDLKT